MGKPSTICPDEEMSDMEAPSEANKLEPKVELRVLGLTSRPQIGSRTSRRKGSILPRIGGNLEKEKHQGAGMVIIDS